MSAPAVIRAVIELDRLYAHPPSAIWRALTDPDGSLARRRLQCAPMPPDPPARYPVSVAVPVAWGEMDAFQHVNNVVYAKWLETARIAYFERLGLVKRVREEGVGPILARTVIDYRRPVTYPDTVRVDAAVSRVGASSFTMSFRVWSKAQDAEVAAGEQVIVHFDYRTGRATPLDEALRAAIAEVEAAQP